MSSEYGWTDQQIGETPLARFRQMIVAIELRHNQQRRREISLLSWQTRVLSQYISGGYMIEKGKPNTALDSASALGYDEMERALMGAGVSKENSAGSYEKLMGFARGMNKR